MKKFSYFEFVTLGAYRSAAKGTNSEKESELATVDYEFSKNDCLLLKKTYKSGTS